MPHSTRSSPALAAKAAGITRAGPQAVSARAERKANAMAVRAVARIMAGSARAPNVCRNRASRVALDPTWKAMAAADVTAAARMELRVLSESGVTGPI